MSARERDGMKHAAAASERAQIKCVRTVATEEHYRKPSIRITEKEKRAAIRRRP